MPLREIDGNEPDSTPKLPTAVKLRRGESAIDAVETKENSPAQPVYTAKAGTGDRPGKDLCRAVRRQRTGLQAHTGRRFKAGHAVVGKMAVQLRETGSGKSVFFRCFAEAEFGRSLPGTLPEAKQDEDCDTDEESAALLRESLLAHLTATLMESP